MAFDQSAGVLTLDPDEVETSPAATALDPSEVEDAPSQSVSSSAQPLPTPETAGGGSRYEANIPNPFPRPAVTPLAPAGAAGPLPGIPQPQVNMQGQPLIQTIFGTDPVKNARMRSEVQDPGYLSEHPPQVYDYGQNAIPRIQQGVKEVATPGQRVRGATDILGGVNDALGSSLLPLGSAPAGVAAGAATSMAGGYAAPALVKAAGGTQEQQDLAREVGTALPMAAGVGADLVRGRASGPEILPPEKPDVYVPPSNRSLSDMTVEQGDTAPQKALAAPEEIAQHPAGKVTGIDVHTGLPLVDRTQPSEVPFSARGEDLPPQTASAGPMSPEAEAVSARAAESPQPASPESGQEESQLPQGDDLSTKLASVGLHGEEANSILDMYGLDPSETSTPEDAQNAAAKPWEEQVRDAYITLADQRGIPITSKDDLFRDQNTARDARNAVEQVISHVYPEADSDGETRPGTTEDSAPSSDMQLASNRPATEQSITLSPGEVEDAPVSSDADRARQNYGDFLDRVGTRTAMESHGQDILDRMDGTGESPRDVSDKFWNETYFDLPAAAQQRFTRMLKNVSGLEPGDTIAVRPDKSGIVAHDWADVANGLLPEKVEHLEGAERGLTALMKEANDRVAGRNSTQQAPNQPQAVSAARPVLQANNQALIPGRRLMPARSSGGPVMPGRSLLGPSSPALTAGTAQAALRPAQPIVGQLQPAQGYSGRANLVPAETATGPRVVLRPAVPGFANTAREQSAAQGENKKPQSQTMYSGAAVFDPEAWKTLFPDVAERFSDWVNDKQDEGDVQAAIMRETRGELDRKVSIAAKQLEKVQRDFRLRPRQDALNFFNAAEGVTTMSSIPAKDQALAATFKGYFDKMKADIQNLNPNVLRDFIENYFPHIWERPSRAATVFTQVLAGKRPFAGSGSFLKQRTIPTIQDGLALGLKPVSYNPVDLFLAKYHEMSRFLMGHKTLGMMKDAGTAKLVRPGTTPPDGWTQLDDRIGTVMSKDDDGHLFIRGHYYAPAPAANVFNAYVSKGLAGRSAIFDTLQAANNRLNALQLGISAFHATTTAVNAAASDIALGTQQLSQGKPLQALKNLAEGVTYVPSMISTFRNGSKLMKEYLSPGSYAKFAREANAVSLAGGRIRQNTLEIKPLTQALDDLKAGAIGSAMKKTIPALIDASSRPIMEQWVPRMKLGAFYGMANNILDTADREGWSQDQTRTRMQTAWDSIDNRFGQMVYDNLFWNKALRDVLMASTRSVGWNAGTIRELGGATVDAAQQAGKVASGNAPELTDRMSFAIGMTVSAGLLGSAIYYLLNGEAPHSLKDAYFPGKSGEARMSVPGYMKDVVAYGHDPKQTILNKMSPVLNMLSEALENRDFYGTEIRHPDDPVVQQLWQLAKFAGAEAVPFSMRGVQKLVQQKGSLETSLSGQVKEALRSPKELAAGQFGFQPAPAYIQNSPALNRAHAYDMANMPPGTRTQEQAEKQRLRAAITIQYRNGHPDHAAIENLVREGKLTQKEVNSAIATAKTEPLVRAARPLHLDQLLNVYADANQAERRELRPVIARKGGDVRKEMDPQRRAALRAALETVLRKGSAGQNSGSRRNIAMP